MAKIIFLNGTSLDYEKMQASTTFSVTVTDAMGVDYTVMASAIQYMSLPAGYLKESMQKAGLKYV